MYLVRDSDTKVEYAMKVLDKSKYIHHGIVDKAKEENEILKICVGLPFII